MLVLGGADHDVAGVGGSVLPFDSQEGDRTSGVRVGEFGGLLQTV